MLAASGKLDRRELVRALLQDRGDMAVVAGLGAPAWDVTAVGDHPLNLPLWGGMGGAAMVGLGLALAQPARRVLVITGDGEMLMGIGSLATIAVQAPANLAILVQDNEHYGETGMQETATRHGVDLAAMAAGAGIRHTMTVREAAELPALIEALRRGPGPVFAVAKVDAGNLPLVLPPREGALLQARMREAILGPGAALE
ncbi:MAG: thiamine pyrophosphate-dependent enzyme [Rhodovarius sp.]|nr:thiamine pyrophosphate-dependent enzyme [Rhodovarius sp.]